MNTTLLRLAAVGKPLDPWEEYSDIIRNSIAIEDADRCGFTVLKSTGTEKVVLPNGLTEGLYEELARWCDEGERGLLAKGVIDNLLRVEWRTWSGFQSFFFKELGVSLEDYLRDVVKEQRGFGVVVSLLRDAIGQYRLLFPHSPSWDVKSYTLRFGGHGPWTFTSRANTQIAVIEALQANKWEPVSPIPAWESPNERRRRQRNVSLPAAGDLDTLQIKFALHELRKRTAGVIQWHELEGRGAWWESLI